METLKFIVTGVGGFLGLYVARELESNGHDVAGFDVVEPKEKLARFIRGDLTSSTDVAAALRGIDSVCHLGGVGDVYLAEKDPELAFRTNAFGTHVLCKESTRAGVDKLIYASTWEVYGRARYQPIDEMHPCNPETPYSVSKLAGELLVRHTGDSGATHTTCLRIGTAYGPGMRETAVMCKFISSAKNGTPLVVSGDGAQFRQFTHARDVARGFRLAAVAANSGPLYNVVARRLTTIRELAELVARRYGADVRYGAPRADDPPSATIDSSLARKEIGWEDEVEFVEGVNELAETLVGPKR